MKMFVFVILPFGQLCSQEKVNAQVQITLGSPCIFFL